MKKRQRAESSSRRLGSTDALSHARLRRVAAPTAAELRREFILDPDVAFLNHGSVGMVFMATDLESNATVAIN